MYTPVLLTFLTCFVWAFFCICLLQFSLFVWHRHYVVFSTCKHVRRVINRPHPFQIPNAADVHARKSTWLFYIVLIHFFSPPQRILVLLLINTCTFFFVQQFVACRWASVNLNSIETEKRLDFTVSDQVKETKSLYVQAVQQRLWIYCASALRKRIISRATSLRLLLSCTHCWLYAMVCGLLISISAVSFIIWLVCILYALVLSEDITNMCFVVDSWKQISTLSNKSTNDVLSSQINHSIVLFVVQLTARPISHT